MKRVLLIFIILVGGYILFQTVTNFSWFAGKDSTSAEVTDKIDKIDFNISSLNLTIVPEERDDLVAEFEGRGDVTVNKKGDTIAIDHKSPWFSWFSIFENSKLTVYLPEDYQRDMSIDLGSGSVHLSGHSAEKPFKLEELTVDLSSGNVNFKNLSVEKFFHDGSSGNLDVETFTSEATTVDISSGNVKLKDFVGKLNADLSSGKLEVQMPRLIDDVHIDVSSGNVQLNLPDDASFTLNGDVGSGNISYDFPLTVEEQSRGDINGTHGSGEHDITIDVSSGNIKIY